jgi:hypothetical protein
VKLIPLTKGQFAQVDDADLNWLNQWTWYASWDKRGKHYYARRQENLVEGGKRKQRPVSMHRQILGLERGDKRKGDHKDPSQTLNNQRNNLRIAKTDNESNANRNLQSNNPTGFKGVSKIGNKYRSRIGTNGKIKNLGTRDTPEAAHTLYVAAAQEQFGEFARAS